MEHYVEPIKSKRDLKRFLDYLKKYRYKYYVIFQLGMMTGLRVSDLLSLNIEDVYNKDYFELKEKKTGKYKKIVLQANTQKIINEYVKKYRVNQYSLTDDNPLFIGKHHKRLDRSQVYREIKKGCKVCGININVGTHTMRKTFGYHHYQQFKDVALLQKIFNHSSGIITLRYIGIYQEEIDDSYVNFSLDNDLNSILPEEENIKYIKVPVGQKEVQYKTKIISTQNKQIKDILDLLNNVSMAGTKNSNFARFLIDYIKEGDCVCE